MHKLFHMFELSSFVSEVIMIDNQHNIGIFIVVSKLLFV